MDTERQISFLSILLFLAVFLGGAPRLTTQFTPSQGIYYWHKLNWLRWVIVRYYWILLRMITMVPDVPLILYLIPLKIIINLHSTIIQNWI